MCSIVGFIARQNCGPNLWRLRKAILANEIRGDDAHGMAWVDANGRFNVYKRPGSFKDHLHVLNAVANARVVICHMRKTTQGPEEHNINNHPHPCDGGWFIHNGIISNYSDLLKKWGLMPSSECDSEVIGLITGRLNKGHAFQWQDAINEVAIDDRLAIMAIYNRPCRLVVAKRGNPLSWWKSAEGFYFGSLGNGFPHRGREFRDNQIAEYSWTRKGGCKRVRTVALKPYTPSYSYQTGTGYSRCRTGSRYGYGGYSTYCTGGSSSVSGGSSSGSTTHTVTPTTGGSMREVALTDQERALLDAKDDGYIPTKYRLEMLAKGGRGNTRMLPAPPAPKGQTIITPPPKSIVEGRFNGKGQAVVVERPNVRFDENDLCEIELEALDDEVVDYEVCERCSAVIRPYPDGRSCDCPDGYEPRRRSKTLAGAADFDDDPPPEGISYVDPDDLDRLAGG